jgi:DnaJ like chaperone protein
MIARLLLIGVCFLLGYWIVAVFIPSLARKPDDASVWPRDDGLFDSGQATPGRPWHEVLGVAADAGKTEVAAAYKHMIGQYHPDKVERMGPEIRELARRRSAEINAAYEAAMKSLDA